MSKNIGHRALVCHVKPNDQPWGQNVRITFQVNCKGQRIINLNNFITNCCLYLVHLTFHLHNQAFRTKCGQWSRS